MLANYPKIRLAIYLLSLACTLASVFVMLYDKDLGTAFVVAAGILDSASFGLTVTNINFSKMNENPTDIGWSSK